MTAEQQSDEALQYGLLGYDAVYLGSQTLSTKLHFTAVTTYQTT